MIQAARTTVFVNGNNVMGSRPNGYWRDWARAALVLKRSRKMQDISLIARLAIGLMLLFSLPTAAQDVENVVIRTANGHRLLSVPSVLPHK